MEVFVIDRARVVVVMGWVREAGVATRYCLPLTGLLWWSKERGLATVHGLGAPKACPPPHPTLPYITPVRASPIGQTCAVHIELPIAIRKIYTAVTWP